MRENKGPFFFFFLRGGLLCLSHNTLRHSRSLAVSLPSPKMTPYPQANTADSLAVFVISQSPPTVVRWPDPVGPKWLPLESQLPAVVVP